MVWCGLAVGNFFVKRISCPFQGLDLVWEEQSHLGLWAGLEKGAHCDILVPFCAIGWGLGQRAANSPQAPALNSVVTLFPYNWADWCGEVSAFFIKHIL